jgi:hypothetical protein
MLRKLAPPHAILHIGAGSGIGEMGQWRQWDVPHALIVDAEARRLDWAEALCAKQPGWHTQSAVLTDSAVEIDYHQASNPEEDGLLPPEQLAPLWPNLRTTEKGLRQGQRLDQLLAKAGNAAFVDTTLAWLIVDCLPALPILKGAGEVLEHCSVLWLRVLLQPISAADNSGALLDQIAAYLLPKGFKCVEVSPSNHPALGHAIFVRDWHALLSPKIADLTQSHAALSGEKDALLQDKAALETRRGALEQELAALGQARDAQAQLAAERLAEAQQRAAERDAQAQAAAGSQAHAVALSGEKDALLQDKAALEARRGALEQELAALGQARDAQAQLAAERLAEAQQRAAERDAQAQAAAGSQAQAVALSGEKDALLQDKAALEARRGALEQELAALGQARDAQAQLAAQRKTEADQLQAKLQQKEASIAQLESELAERDTRQHLLNEEMIRAEAQIDLIKDVLLREPGL